MNLQAAGPTAAKPPGEETRAAFLRQGTWVSLASFTGGFACYLVHLFAQKAGTAEYGNFTAAIRLLEMAAWPAVGLQTLIAHQTASARTPDDHAKLAASTAALAKAIGVAWLLAGAALFALQGHALRALHIAHPATMAIAFCAALAALLLPLAAGTLQGRQQFTAFGGAVLANGLVRLAAVAMLFEVLRWRSAPSAMSSVLLGYLAALALAWQAARRTWAPSAGTRVPWADWLRRFVPISLGAGAGIFLASADMVFAQRHFGNEAGLYAAASTMGRVLPMLLGPVIAVMFPKVVSATGTLARSNALWWTLAITGAGGALIAFGLTLWPELPLRMARFKPEYAGIAPLIPKLAWAMLPLVLGGVLVNYLLARGDHRVVPWLVVVCIGFAVGMDYGCAHWASATVPLPDRFAPLAMTLALANTGYLLVASWFVRLHRREEAAAAHVG